MTTDQVFILAFLLLCHPERSEGSCLDSADSSSLCSRN